LTYNKEIITSSDDDSRLIEKDINGVEYSYENHSELAFGTIYEGEENEENENIRTTG
jgi:hypothetical protein